MQLGTGACGYGPTMKCVISHMAAYLWLVRHTNQRAGDAHPSRASLSDAGAPTAEQTNRLRWFLDLEDTPLDVLVTDPRHRRHSHILRSHLCSGDLPSGSLIPIASGIEQIDLYCVCPELCFIQLCRNRDEVESAFFGMALCSDYRLDAISPSGVVHREHNDSRLTDIESLRRYIRSASREHGAKAAASILSHICEGSRSPKESGIALFYGLPQRLGGMALGEVHMNPALKVFEGRDTYGNDRFATRYPDVMFTSKPARGTRRAVAFDYDSQAEHTETWKVLADSRRRNTLAAVENLVHYSIRMEDAQDYRYLVSLGDQARKILGRRPWPQIPGFPHHADARMKAGELEHRRFELWSRLLQGGGPDRLLIAPPAQR